MTPSYIDSLEKAEELTYRNLFYWPRSLKQGDGESNDNSTAKLFRTGAFTVLSLGDLEDPQISSAIRNRGSVIQTEVDIMILAHHGANNGFTSASLLKKIRPRLAVCTSNYDNEYGHPDEAIQDLLHKLDIPVMTTKTGDLVVTSLNKKVYRAHNLIENSTEMSSTKDFKVKRAQLLDGKQSHAVVDHYARKKRRYTG